MGFERKTWYLVLGTMLVLALVFGAVVTFAQTDGDATDPVPPQTESDEGSGAAPGIPGPGFRGFNRPPTGDLTSDLERLAEALDISVEELQAAHEEARIAMIEQALADGLITQEQADQLLAGGTRFRGHLGHGIVGLAGHDEFLAEALGISVEELQAARSAAHAARLQEMVDAGLLTQEQADLMAAQQTVQSYVDREALSAMIQEAHEAAVAQALADGAISQAQADLLLENTPRFAPFGGVGRGLPGQRGFHGGRGFHGSPGHFFRGQPPASGESSINPATNA